MTQLYRVILWLHPWTQAAYPGRGRAFRSIFSRPLTKQAVQNWDKRGVPEWACRELAAHMRAKQREAGEHADWLEYRAKQLSDQPKRLYGICAVDPVTGRDRRGVAARAWTP